jgi:hypothetical protein
MTPPKSRTPPPRIAVSVTEAADSVGLSLNEFTRYVLPKLRVIRQGRRKLVPLSELEKWAEKNAARPLLDED